MTVELSRIADGGSFISVFCGPVTILILSGILSSLFTFMFNAEFLCTYGCCSFDGWLLLVLFGGF